MCQNLAKLLRNKIIFKGGGSSTPTPTPTPTLTPTSGWEKIPLFEETQK
jgi:hypothetical protein